MLFFSPVFLIITKVVGDKTAWTTSSVFLNMPHDALMRLVENTENNYRVKMKFIHIIRNPFDIVSTITLRNTKQRGGRFEDHTEKVRDLSCSKSLLSLWEITYTYIHLHFIIFRLQFTR